MNPAADRCGEVLVLPDFHILVVKLNGNDLVGTEVFDIQDLGLEGVV